MPMNSPTPLPSEVISRAEIIENWGAGPTTQQHEAATAGDERRVTSDKLTE